MRKELLLMGLSLFSVTLSAQQIHSILNKKHRIENKNIHQSKSIRKPGKSQTKRVSENSGNPSKHSYRMP